MSGNKTIESKDLATLLKLKDKYKDEDIHNSITKLRGLTETPKVDPLSKFLPIHDIGYGISTTLPTDGPQLRPASYAIPTLTQSDYDATVEPKVERDGRDTGAIKDYFAKQDNVPLDLTRPKVISPVNDFMPPSESGLPPLTPQQLSSQPVKQNVSVELEENGDLDDVYDSGVDTYETPLTDKEKGIERSATDYLNMSKGIQPSENIQVESTPVESTPVESPDRAPSSFDEQLDAAREQDRQSNLLMGLLKASQMGGAALAGSKADTSYADAELAKGNQAVNRLKTDSDMKEQEANILQKRDKRDPASNQSKMYQDILLKLNPGMDVSGLSAEDVEKAFPSIASAVGRQDALAAAAENAKLKREEMSVTKGEKSELQDEKQNFEIQKTVDKMVNNLRNSDDYKTYQASKAAQAALDNAISSGNKTDTGSAFMLYAKIAQGDNSVVRESDMKNLAGSYNYSSPSEMFSKLSAKAAGGNFNTQELKQMKNIATLIQKIKAKHIKEQLAPIQSRMKKYNLDPDEIISPEMTREFSDNSEPKSTTVNKTESLQDTGTVTIKSKKTGTTKTLSAESAAKYLKDPNFERVK